MTVIIVSNTIFTSWCLFDIDKITRNTTEMYISDQYANLIRLDKLSMKLYSRDIL